MSRQIFAVTGADRVPFLQGLTSNDLLVLAQRDGIVWTALLTPQGKYLADFFVVMQGGRLFLDVDAGIAEATIKRLLIYRLRADVQISAADIFVTCGVENQPAGALHDPRHAAMGWRFYGEKRRETHVDWDAVRVAHIIPQTAIELIPNETYILEAGFERLHGVDFRKGCYVGQEVTARMKHKTELRKGLVRVAISGAAPVGSEITAGGRAVGTLFTQSGGFALAHLRFDLADGDMAAGDAALRLTA